MLSVNGCVQTRASLSCLAFFTGFGVIVYSSRCSIDPPTHPPPLRHSMCAFRGISMQRDIEHHPVSCRMLVTRISARV